MFLRSEQAYLRWSPERGSPGWSCLAVARSSSTRPTGWMSSDGVLWISRMSMSAAWPAPTSKTRSVAFFAAVVVSNKTLGEKRSPIMTAMAMMPPPITTVRGIK